MPFEHPPPFLVFNYFLVARASLIFSISRPEIVPFSNKFWLFFFFKEMFHVAQAGLELLILGL